MSKEDRERVSETDIERERRGAWGWGGEGGEITDKQESRA